jgi:hypothetical protein
MPLENSDIDGNQPRVLRFIQRGAITMAIGLDKKF